MKRIIKFASFLLALISVGIVIGCEDTSNNYSSYNMHYMHYFFTDYGSNSAMIRTPDNSDVAVLATTESGKGGNLYEVAEKGVIPVLDAGIHLRKSLCCKEIDFRVKMA